MTVLMRKRISRHIEQCEVCGERKRRELTPALFAGAMPLVALFPGFRQQLLRMLADRSPAGLAHRLTVANRAGPFGPNGFPNAHQAARDRAVAPRPAPSAGPAGGNGHGGHGGGGHRGRGHRRVAPRPAVRRGRGRIFRTARPSAPRARPRRAAARPAAAGYGSAPSPSTPGGTTAPDCLPVAGSAGFGLRHHEPRRRPPRLVVSLVVTRRRPRPRLGSAGTLSVSTGQLDLVSVNGTATGTFTLTAHGGPVPDYSVTVGSALAGHISVSPVLRVAGLRCERDDHRDLNQPGRPGRAAHREPRWPDDHVMLSLGL